MARRSPSHLLLVLVLVALLLPLTSSPALQAEQAYMDVQADTPIPSSIDVTAVLEKDAQIRINEVMPKPEEGAFEWVELHRPSVYVIYLPLILRNATSSVADNIGTEPPPSQSVSSAGQFDISGWQITDEDGNKYEIPDELPEVPPGAYVLVFFDGSGPDEDDYDFGDGLAELHTSPSSGLVEIFEDEADQVALYSSSSHSPETIADFVAWGELPGDDVANAGAAGIWSEYSFVNMDIGFGAKIEGVESVAGASLGLHPGRTSEGPAGWSVYLGEDLSPGAANRLPRPYASTVADGQEMAADGFALGWSWVPDAEYQFQMDEEQSFESPVVDVVLDAPWYAPEGLLPSGEYFWRVRAIAPGGDLSGWTAPAAIGVSALEEGGSGLRQVPSVAAEEVVPYIQWLRQRKDTRLLCLDGCQEGDPNDDSPEEAWDSPHPDNKMFEHGKSNCVRASIAMIVTRYNRSLSQDRIAYYELEEEEKGDGIPWGDLAHNIGGPAVCEPDGTTARNVLAWALGLELDPQKILYGLGKPTFEDIKGWIDEGRPVLRIQTQGGPHASVIAGYRERFFGLKKEVWLLDPQHGPSRPNYERNFDVFCYYVAPASAPDVRPDELAVSHDSDFDDIMDWDETTRWAQTYNNLDADDPDTDGDGVTDKLDMREYLFDDAGESIYPRWISPDIDGDDLFKEVDADNDDGGSPDGCEDTNRNGRYEPGLGETSNFDPDDEKDCDSPYDDEFDDESLDPKWYWIREDPTHWSLTEHSGYLRIITQPKDIWRDNNSAPLLLQSLLPLTGDDFEVSTRVVMTPIAYFHQGGLVIYADDDNYVRFTYAYIYEPAFEFAKEVGGNFESIQVPAPPDADGFHLRIVKLGMSYYGYYSQDGEVWTLIGEHENVEIFPSEIGILAFNAEDVTTIEIPADFDFFGVTQPVP